MKKALFLDRDGIINIEKKYLYKPDDLEFIDGIFEVCRYACECGYLLVVVTNQAGIGRGYYTEQDFQDLTQWMMAEFAKRFITIFAIYHCPHHPQGGIGHYRMESFDRKPNPGMILKAQTDLGIDLSKSILLGDKESDIEAAINAGVACSVLIGDEKKFKSTKANLSFPDLLTFLACFQQKNL
jgi:D-glycero-D-manno-heptose 1,7-bisphosphate phosphatase